MPAHKEADTFWRDWALLTQPRRQLFQQAIQKMTADLKVGKGFRKGLRIKGVKGHPGIYEMTWADDGRATFSYGLSPHRGDTHIIWRRIGAHESSRTHDSFCLPSHWITPPKARS